MVINASTSLGINTSALGVAASSGATDSGKLVALAADGFLDATFLKASADYLFPYLKATGGAIHADILSGLSAGRLAVGDVIQWAGYWQGSDLGGGIGRIVASGTGTNDGGSYINAGSFQIKQVFGGIVDVSQFGAKEDGATDATSAIRAAITAVAAGGTLRFPPGVFLVSGSGTIFTLATAGVTMCGVRGASRIKVADTCGNYQTMFSITADRVTIKDLWFDQNPTGNTGADIGLPAGRNQFVLSALTGATGVRVDNCLFDPICGVNTIAASTTSGNLNLTVADNYFNFVVGSSPSTSGTYDNSAIYIEGSSHRVVNNTFHSSSTAARGCIESHGGRSVVSGNVSLGYQTLCNVVSTSVSATELVPNNIVVSGNSALDCILGITLWPGTGRTIRNVVTNGNIISVKAGTAPTGNWGIGVAHDPTSTGGIVGWECANNVIDMEASEAALTQPSESAGIQAYVAAGGIRDAQFVNNVIRNAPSQGLRLSCGAVTAADTIRGVRIAGNTITDAGNNSTIAPAAYRSAILVAGLLDVVDIEQNIIVDTGSPAINGLYGIQMLHDGASTNVKIGNNTIRSASGSLTNVYGASEHRIDLGQVAIKSGAGSPEGSVTAPVGSVYLRNNGTTGATLYVKESGAGNTGWAATSAGASTPPVNVTVTGDGATTVFTVTHNLALTTPFLPSSITVLDPGGNILSGSSYALSNALTNSFTVTFAVAPANGAVHTFRVTA